MTPLIIAYILNIIDYLFTAYWVRLYGIGIEANPIGRWMFENEVAGLVKIILVGGLFVLLGYFIKRHQKAVIVAYILFGVFAVIVAYHIFILIMIR